MSRDDLTLLSMLDARMSPASIASTWGVKLPTMERRLAKLVADRAAAQAQPETPAAVVDVRQLVIVAPAPEPPDPEPIARPGCTFVSVISGPVGSSMGDSRPVLALAKPPISRKALPEARRYNPVSPAKLRFARWFLAARWKLAEVADLFDIEAEDLAEALA